MADSNYTKWQINILSACIFILVAYPYTYRKLRQYQSLRARLSK